MNKKSKIFKSIKILNNNELFLILLILLFSSLAIMLEFLSIASIPLFFSFLLEIEANNIFIDNILKINQSLFSSPNNVLFFIITIFFIKSSFLFLLSIFEFISFKRVRLRLGEKLITQIIKPNFNLNIADSSATKIWKIEIINHFAGLMAHLISFVRNVGYIFVIIIFLILYSSANVIYFIFGLFVLISIYFFLVSKKLKKSGEYLSIGGKDKVNAIQNIVNGVKDINILRRFNFFVNRFKLSNIKLEKFTQRNLIFSNFPIHYLEFFGVIIIVSFFFYLTSQNLDPLEILVSISLIAYGGLRIIGLMKTCINNLNFYKKSSFAIGVLFDEFEKKYENSDTLNSIKYEQKLNNNSSIILSNLSYDYQNGKRIFNNINLEFESNKIYCLRGKSGSGKSTFLDIMLGIKNFSSGELLIKYNRSEIGYVSQECYIIEDTIKNNIAFGIDPLEIDDEKVLKAAKEAQIYDFIKSLPLKFETKLNPFGSNISIGQKQRIGIARTLYNNSKILFLDEPTSSLDHETSENFLKILNEIKENRLIIITSHKKDVESYLDYILDINNDGSINFSKK